MTKVVIDTNIILSNPDVILRDDIEIILPYVVLRELDGLKRNPDLNYSARSAIKNIKAQYLLGKLVITDVPSKLETNDELIVQTAKDNNASIYTDDIGAQVVALSNFVDVFDDTFVEFDKNYIGYRYLTVPSDFYYHVLNMVNNLQHPEVEEVISELIKDNPIAINEAVIFSPDDGSLNYKIFRKRVSDFSHISESSKVFRGLNKEGRKIDFNFLHPEQAIAFDCVFNSDTPLAVVSGKIGSGKTILSTLAALSRVVGTHANRKYNSILLTRPNTPISKEYAIGFLPGDTDSKLAPWLGGVITNLQFLFEHNQEDREKEVAKTLFKECMEAVAIESIQGASYNSHIFLVDEGQLLSKNALRQIMSRIASGSKLVLVLDAEQTYGANRGNEGWKTLLPHMKNSPLVSYIDLQHIQRSKLTSFVNDIFK